MKPHVLRPLAAAVLLAVCGAASQVASAAVIVTDVGKGSVTDMSDDGNTAVGLAPGTLQVFRWTAAGGWQGLGRNSMTKLGTGGGVPAVSADGSVVSASVLDPTRQFVTQGRWTVEGGWQDLGPLPPDGGVMDLNAANVFGMSRDGKVVTGLYWRPGQTGGAAHGSVWTAATGMVGLPTDGGSSRVDDANADGTVLAGWEESAQYGVRRPVVWVNGVRTFLEDDIGWPGEATKLNAAGTVVVGQSHDASQKAVAARWMWNGQSWDLTTLGVLPGGTSRAFTAAFGASADGSIVVGFGRDNPNKFQGRGFVWTAETGIVDVQVWLETQGADLKSKFKINEVAAISPDGRFLMVTGNEVAPPFAAHTLRIERLDVARRH